MPELNCPIPRFRCFVRDQFLYALDPERQGVTAGTCHAISAIPGRALGFHVLLDNGASIWRLPIHALLSRPDGVRIPPEKIWQRQLWDCFSAQVTVTEFDWFSESRMRVMLPNKTVMGGRYMFTVDYHGSDTAEDAGPAGHKCHHVVELDDGTYAAQPNNRVQFFEPSCVQPFSEPPGYRIMPRTWKTEDGGKWRTEDSDAMFYGVEEAPA